jgi:hypothetical protein
MTQETRSLKLVYGQCRASERTKFILRGAAAVGLCHGNCLSQRRPIEIAGRPNSVSSGLQTVQCQRHAVGWHHLHAGWRQQHGAVERVHQRHAAGRFQQELKISTNNADITVGTCGGAQVNAFIKSGTNSLHSSAYRVLSRGYAERQSVAPDQQS